MVKTVSVFKGQKPTKEQIKEIEEASKRPIFYDEDSPELAPEMYAGFIKADKLKNNYKAVKITSM